MKTVVKILAFTLMLVALFYCFPANATTNTLETSIANRFTGLVNNGISYSVLQMRTLLDSSGTSKYQFVEFTPYGSAIYNTETNLFEEMYFDETVQPFDGYENNDCYYFGPGNYYYSLNDELKDVETDAVLSESDLASLMNYETRKEAFESSRRTTSSSRAISFTPVTTTYQVTNLISNRTYFTSLLDNSYGYNTTGTCSMIAAAILLGYYDVYVDDNFITDAYRDGYGTNEYFHDLMIAYIDQDGSGAGSCTEIVNGVNNYLTHRGVDYDAVGIWTSYTTLYGKVQQQISAGYPMIVIMFESAGATWNHSVVVYGYVAEYWSGDDELLSVYYHVHTGWHSTKTGTYNYSWFYDGVYLSAT